MGIVFCLFLVFCGVQFSHRLAFNKMLLQVGRLQGEAQRAADRNASMAAQVDAQEKELVDARVELAKMGPLLAELAGSEQRVQQLHGVITAKEGAVAAAEAEIVRCVHHSHPLFLSECVCRGVAITVRSIMLVSHALSHSLTAFLSLNCVDCIRRSTT